MKLDGRLAVSLMMLAIFLLLRRRDLDDERPEPPSKIKRR